MSLDGEDEIITSNKTSRRNFLKGAAAGGAIAAVVVAGVAEMSILGNNKTPTTSNRTRYHNEHRTHQAA